MPKLTMLLLTFEKIKIINKNVNEHNYKTIIKENNTHIKHNQNKLLIFLFNFVQTHNYIYLTKQCTN